MAPNFEELICSMMTLLGKHNGEIDLGQFFDRVDLPLDGLKVKILPVGPDGQLSTISYGLNRKGFQKIGRSKQCFDNALSLDICCLGSNINFKLAKKSTVHMVGCRTEIQALKACELLLDTIHFYFPELDRFQMISLTLTMANYRYKVPINLNLMATAVSLNKHNNWIVSYDNSITNHIYAIHKSKVPPKKKGKIPTHKLKIKSNGSIIHYGPDLKEMKDLYEKLMIWFQTFESEIKG